MKIKVSEATELQLDWLVARCEGFRIECDYQYTEETFFAGWWQCGPNHWQPLCKYSTDWSQGGPIIEREFIKLQNQTSFSGGWEAWKWDDEKQDYLIIGKRGAYCPTPLIAAMRCYVASKLGDEVEVPDELA